jgi:hypothetical protein
MMAMLRPMAVLEVAMCRAYGQGLLGATVRGATSELRHNSSRPCRKPNPCGAALNANLSSHHGELEMKTERPAPNAELDQAFEPLRLVFAITALLLGVVASAHF